MTCDFDREVNIKEERKHENMRKTEKKPFIIKNILREVCKLCAQTKSVPNITHAR